MQTVDSVDGEIRFTTEWGGRRRFIFIDRSLIETDAGRPLSRAEAMEFVRGNLTRYAALAKAEYGEDTTLQTFELPRLR